MVLAALLILWIGAFTDLDLRLADASYDAPHRLFPWRDTWLADRFSHVLLKRALTCLALLFIGAALWDWVWPRRWSGLLRLQLRVVALSALLVPAAIALLKQLSVSHCPWDLQRYGGSAPYVRLLQAMPSGIDPGHCMPAGHASSALWMISLAVFFLPARPRAAGVALALLLAAGFGMGWLQQLRGAHFLTHTLWSMWIASAIVAIVTALLARRTAL